MNQVSIVVVTRNRDEDLKELLQSILIQTKLPKEVIIVDDSDSHKTKILIEQMRGDFSNRKIALKYMRGTGKGISAARNIGIAQSSGTIYCGIDDDVILDSNYLKEILRVYRKYPNAVGVGGFITNSGDVSILSNSLNRVFFLFHRERDRCRILPSGIPTYPYSLSKIIESDWLSGTNASYKIEVLKDFRYDENLEGYSLGEDKEISCSIRKRYPNSLYLSPYAKVIHKNSPIARRNTKHLIYLSIVYPTYFFNNYVEQTLLNKMIFIWSIFGRFVTALISKKPKAREILFLMGACMCTLKHLKEVKEGNFSFLGFH